jgi:flagellar basal body-associated protein FliL
MAKETAPTDPKAQQPNQTPAPEPKKSTPIKKILIIGGPILLVQIVVVYFLVSKFFAPAVAQNIPTKGSVSEEKKSGEEQTPQIVVIKDVIVNPAGTNGSHLLVTTVGLEVPTTEGKVELEQKEVQTRDILVTILTGKRMDELTTPEQKEILREEIHQRINKILKAGPLSKVYISKFILQ